MIREMLSHLHWSVLPVTSMCIFLGIFIGVLMWVYRKESHQVYREMGTFPLEDEQ